LISHKYILCVIFILYSSFIFYVVFGSFVHLCLPAFHTALMAVFSAISICDYDKKHRAKCCSLLECFSMSQFEVLWTDNCMSWFFISATVQVPIVRLQTQTMCLFIWTTTRAQQTARCAMRLPLSHARLASSLITSL